MTSIAEGIQRLRANSTGEGETVFLPPMAQQQDPMGKQTRLWSNVFRVQMGQRDVTLYRYEVDVYVSTENLERQVDTDPKKVLALTRTSFQGARMMQAHEICGKIVYQILNEEEVISWTNVFYNNHRELYTTERIDGEADGRIQCSVHLDATREPAYRPYKYAKVVFQFQEELLISEGNLPSCKGTPKDVKLGAQIIKFIEIVTTKPCMDQVISEPGEICQLSGNRVYFAKATEPLDEGKQLMCGIYKTVDLIEGETGRNGMAVGITMDATKICVLKPVVVIETACIICGKDFKTPATPAEIQKLNRVLKGVVVVARYSNIHLNMKIERIVEATATTSEFTDHENKKWTVYDYFKDVKNQELRYPNAPLAEITRQGKKMHFPLEFMGILPGNVVSTERQTPEIMSAVVKSSAMIPSVRMDAIVEGSKRQNILGPHEGSNCFVERAPLQVNARILAAPEIAYSGAKHTGGIDERGSWRRPMSGKFLHTGQIIKQWAFLVITESPRVAQSINLDDFIAKFISGCKQKGLNVPQFGYCQIIPPIDLEGSFRALAEKNFDFILFGTEDKLKLQDDIKYYERKYKVATQNIKLSTIQATVEKGRTATVENLVQKLNCKLSGVNHAPERREVQFTKSFRDGEIFVLGIGDVLSLRNSTGIEAAEAKLPLILSYAGNFGPLPSAIIGDFSIEDMSLTAAKASGASLFIKSLDALSELKKAGKRKLPENYVVYRNGATPKDMEKIIQEEIPAIKDHLLERVGPNHRLLYIMAHKNHATRFFKTDLNPKDRPPQQNLFPGTVVDSCITHPHLRQFYVNAHVALQGSAKCPRYTVLYDDTNASMNYLETMTYDLCFMHQIVNLPTGLPSPLRIAEEYGKRGKRILIKYCGENSGELTGDSVKRALEYKHANEFKHRRINA